MNEKRFTPHLGRPYWFLHYVAVEDQFIPDQSYWSGDENDKKMLFKNLLYRNEADCWTACYEMNKRLKEFRQMESNPVTE